MDLDHIRNDRTTYRECRRMLSAVKRWRRYLGATVLAISILAPQYAALELKAQAKAVAAKRALAAAAK